MKRYGWFEYKQEPRKIVNYLTRQELAISAVTNHLNVTTYDGYYSDNEITQSVRFIFHYTAPNWAGIRLDYRDTLPHGLAYGHWRRIDDFLVDALLCWPDFLNGTLIGGGLLTTGGWKSGVWDAEFKRQFAPGKSGTPDQLKDYKIAEPYVIPLETNTPPAWKLIDHDFPATEAKLKFQRLDGSNIPYLPNISPAEGFQGAVPYLEREDKAAYIIFSKLQPESHRGEDAMSHLYYTFVDQEIFFIFRSSPFYNLELGTCIDYGFRELPPCRELWTTKILGELVPWDQPRPIEDVLSKYSYLSYPAWLRIWHALGDAWPAWGSQRRRVEIDKQVSTSSNYGRTGFIGDYGPAIQGGFSAGMRNSYFNVSYPNAK